MMGSDPDRPTPVPNGNAAPFDLSNPDLHEVAGFVVSLSVDVKETKAEVKRIGRVADRIATSLGIPLEGSDPPPNYRAQQDSHSTEIAALQRARDEERAELEALRKKDEELEKHDADTTGNLKAVSAEVALTKTELAEQKALVQSKVVETSRKFIESLPKLAQVGIGLTAAIGALTFLLSQIWAALKGH